jgi:hypothetical protein
MISRKQKGNTGHFLWLPVGSGKTMIVAAYLIYLFLIDILPKYASMSVPQNAFKTYLLILKNVV